MLSIESDSLIRLTGIGLGPREQAWASHLEIRHGHAGLSLRRVAEVHRDELRVTDGQDTWHARALPSLLEALDAESDALAVGDWVAVCHDRFGDHWVHFRAPPRNQLTRRLHDGRDKVERVVIVSNVDVALLVMGLDLDFNLRRLARYVSLVQLAGVRPVAVLTKPDTATDRAGQLDAVRGAVPAGTAVVALSPMAGDASDVLAPWLSSGQTLVLLGSSGAGKSTLTNALCRQAHQDTGATRAGDGRGRHTTTVRSLHLTDHGACIIDTPGLRTLRLDTDEAALSGLFGDVQALSQTCRFRDCRHEAEPGCAVREHLGAERLLQWHKLQREARRDTMSALERQRQLSEWKQRTRAGRARALAKQRS